MDKHVQVEGEKLIPFRYSDHLEFLSAQGFLAQQDDALIWRGPLKVGAEAMGWLIHQTHHRSAHKFEAVLIAALLVSDQCCFGEKSDRTLTWGSSFPG